MKLDHVSLCAQRKIVLTLLVAALWKKTRQAHPWQAGRLTSRVMITYLASHRLFLYIFGGNKSRTPGTFIGYTSL